MVLFVKFMVLVAKEILELLAVQVTLLVSALMEGVRVEGGLSLRRTELLNSIEAVENTLNVDVSFAVTEATAKPAGNNMALG